MLNSPSLHKPPYGLKANVALVRIRNEIFVAVFVVATPNLPCCTVIVSSWPFEASLASPEDSDVFVMLFLKLAPLLSVVVPDIFI